MERKKMWLLNQINDRVIHTLLGYSFLHSHWDLAIPSNKYLFQNFSFKHLISNHQLCFFSQSLYWPDLNTNSPPHLSPAPRDLQSTEPTTFALLQPPLTIAALLTCYKCHGQSCLRVPLESHAQLTVITLNPCLLTSGGSEQSDSISIVHWFSYSPWRLFHTFPFSSHVSHFLPHVTLC